MSTLSTVLLVVFIILSIAAVGLTLLLRYKGSGISGMFGSGASTVVSSSTIAERNIRKAYIFTVVLWAAVAIAEAVVVAHIY